MPPEPPAAEAPGAGARPAEALAARLLASLEGLDLTSADGRAGIQTLLSEIERACPGAILQQAARIELRAVGWGKGGAVADMRGPVQSTIAHRSRFEITAG